MRSIKHAILFALAWMMPALGGAFHLERTGDQEADHRMIQTALDQSGDYTSIFLGPGVWDLPAPVRIQNRQKVLIRGTGNSTVLRCRTIGLVCVKSHLVRVEDIRFSGLSSDAGTGILLQQGNMVQVSNCQFYKLAVGLRATETLWPTVRDTSFVQCATGISLQHSNAAVIDGCVFNGMISSDQGGVPDYAGFWAFTGVEIGGENRPWQNNSNRILACSFENLRHGLVLHDGGTWYGNTLRDTRFENVNFFVVNLHQKQSVHVDNLICGKTGKALMQHFKGRITLPGIREWQP